jgi:hypothetical protein
MCISMYIMQNQKQHINSKAQENTIYTSFILISSMFQPKKL